MDRPDRNMVAQAFTKEHIESKRPEIQATVNGCLDEMIKGGCKEPVDLVEKFALPVPSEVCCCLTEIHRSTS